MNKVDAGPPPEPDFLSDSQNIQEGLRMGGVGVWRWKVDSDELGWTRNLESVHHLPAGSFDGSLMSFQRDLHPDDADAVWRKIKSSIETGEPYRAVYRTAPDSNQDELWIEASGGIVTSTDGSRYLTGVCFDATVRVRSEAMLERRLTQQRAIAQFGSFALSEDSLQQVLNEAVRLAAEVLDVPLTKVLQFSDAADHLVLRAGVGWADGLVGQGKVGIERASQAGFTLLAGEPVVVRDLLSETRFSGPQLLHDHGVRSGMSVVIPGPETRAFGVFGIHAREVREFDDTDSGFLLSLANIVAGAVRQASAADSRMLLVREMAHRAGNMLQLVTSIASQTFSAEAETEVAKTSFADRLNALAQSNYIVARGGWTSTRFTEMVQEILRPFGERIVTQGRDILLPPDLCFDMGLVLHELATNAVKYGSLGRDQGAVSVSWRTFHRTDDASNVFAVQWEDSLDRPAVETGASGFGSKLIRALVERKWNGLIQIGDTANYSITLEIPLST